MAKQKFMFQPFTAGKPPVESEIKENEINEPVSEKEEPGTVGKLSNRLSEKKSEKKKRSPYDTKYIPRNLIKANEKNKYPKYSKSKIESLKETILHFGLVEVISVIYIREDNEYIIEAGHNRTYAIDELIEYFKEYPEKESPEYQLYLKNVDIFAKKGYPCLVKDILAEGVKYYYDSDTDLSDIPEQVIDSEIRLIITNEIRRDETASVKALNVARLAKLYERKNIGKRHNEKVNVNEQIASDLNITARQVANYKRIGKLIPGLQAAFDEHKISLKEGSSYAQLPEEEQEVILSMINTGKKVSEEEVNILKKEKKALQDAIKAKDNELEDLEKEVKNLTAALEEKQDVIEPVFIPDPELPGIKEKLSNKEKEVEKLKKELKELKEQSSARKKMNAAQSDLIKKDLALRQSFEKAKKAIRKFIEDSETLVDSYGNVSTEELSNMSIMSRFEIDDKKKYLTNLFK